MKNFTLITSALLLLLITDSSAQLTGITRAPLQLGNIWVYDHGPYTNTLSKTTVNDTNIIIDTIQYFEISIESNYGGGFNYQYSRLKEDGFYALRRDSTYPEPNHERLYYKKNAFIGDTWIVQGVYVYSIEDTFMANVFGESTTVKYLKIDSGLELYHEYWTEKFGLLSRSSFHGLQISLLGCVIDGVVYGDTSFTLVGVEDELKPADNFFLEQNYPNPFNPTTSIQYSVGSRQFVTLKVYDVLGNQLATLINEEKSAGSYRVEFDATGLSSGTYFYRITAGNFSETKKMLLTK